MASDQAGFAGRLRAWRDRARLKQSEAARILDVGRTYYSKLESGSKTPGKFLVEKFELIEHEPVLSERPESAQRAQEAEGDYETVKHVIYIEEHGTPEQKALAAAFLKTLREQLPWGKPDQSGDKSP